MRVAGYLRVSTGEQADSGLGLEAQRQAITAECDRRGWQLVHVFEDAASGKDLRGRDGLAEAIAAVESQEAEALVCSKLDRLSRSLLDFAALMDRSRRKGWALVALDLGVDTSSPGGELMANVLATFAVYERRLTGQRTRDALAVKRAQGVRLGRPRSIPDDVRDRIRALHGDGLSLPKIAAALEQNGVPTARGGRRWYPSTVRAVIAE